jgi:hypothetical protein
MGSPSPTCSTRSAKPCRATNRKTHGEDTAKSSRICSVREFPPANGSSGRRQRAHGPVRSPQAEIARCCVRS